VDVRSYRDPLSKNFNPLRLRLLIELGRQILTIVSAQGILERDASRPPKFVRHEKSGNLRAACHLVLSHYTKCPPQREWRAQRGINYSLRLPGIRVIGSLVLWGAFSKYAKQPSAQ
jgi:hypothetical protein